MRRSVARVVVVGSLNVDYIASVERLPVAGQTVAASGLVTRFGGKGANQAVAAARQGAAVTLVGCAGDDDQGRAYLRRLRQEHIDVRGVRLSRAARTGTALIAVDAKAENTIVVAAGANGEAGPRQVQIMSNRIRNASALLVQFELPFQTVEAAIACAVGANVPVILNPSPLRRGFEWSRAPIDSLVANAGEAREIFALPPGNIFSQSKAWRSRLEKFQIRTLIVTRGSRSTLCLTRDVLLEVPTLKVRPLDTVGAGDAFAGVYAACRAEGLGLGSCIRLANCAGALTTLKRGAQEAIPYRAATARAARQLGSSREY